MIDQCERYMAWIKHYASKLAYLLWLTPSGQVAHATLDRRLCRTRIFNPEMFRYNYTPHSMRHTTATHMLEAGVPLIVVKNFLGHVSLQTTQIYTEITQDTMNKQLKSWNDKWFLKDNSHFENTNGKSNIPEFLR